MIKIPLRKSVLNYMLECKGSCSLFQQIQFKMFSKVNPDSNQHGGELVASVLQAHGVKYLFTLIGGHISPVVVAAENAGIRVIDTRHEATTVFAADAVARLSGTVGVAAVTAGPGLTNTITAVKNAQMAESPVLLLGGAAATLLKGRGSLQDIDQLSLFKSLCKYSATIKSIRDIVPTVRKALNIAQSGTPGPVFIEFPIDVLYPYNLVRKELGSRKEGKTISQKVINWYMDMHLNNLFAGAFEPRETKPLPVEVPLATNAQVQKCVDLLFKAKKPLILLGSQALLPPTLAENLRKALESLGIPCFLGGMARGLLGRNSPLHMRQKRKEALKDADVVVLAGAICDFRLSYGQVLSRKSKIIAVNRSKEQLLKNTDIFWKPTVAVQGSVCDFVIRLAEQLKGYSCDKEWIKLLRERDNEKEEQNRIMAEQTAEKHLNPLKVLYDLEETMDENTVLVADGGDFVSSAAYILRARDPLKWLDPGAFGTLGVGAGFAIGAKLCYPDSDVVIIYGDGSLGYSMIEFDTFVRHKLPIVAVVGNDACWTQISREQVPLFKSNVACDLAFSNYHNAVEGLGAKGIIIKAEDKDRITSLLRNAIDHSRQGESVLVNALIGKTTFRSGSISV